MTYLSQKSLFFLIFAPVFCVLTACNSSIENASTANLSTVEKMHFSQYVVYGQQLYNQHCSNCHQEDGSGLGRVIPPLAKSDYMLSDINRTICIIKNGIDGEIIVNELNYNQKMPSNHQLTNLEIAQITTYILNEWENNEGYVSVNDVAKVEGKCN